MRNLFALLLALSLAVTLAACGPALSSDTRTVAERFELDLSGLSQESLDKYHQDLDLTSTKNGTTVQLKEVLGDTRTVYLLYTVTYSESPDQLSPLTSDSLIIANTEGDPMTSGIGSMADYDGNTAIYTWSIDRPAPAESDTDWTVTVHTEQPTPADHTFHLTLSAAQVRTADLMDAQGQNVGTATVTPFQFGVQPNVSVSTYGEPDPVLTILDTAGNPMEGLINEGVNYGVFRRPVEVETIKALTIGDLTATF